MNLKNKSLWKVDVKTIVAIGIGAALFFVLGRFVTIPSPVANTYINIQYGVLGFMAALFGPIAGCLIGLIGHALIDLTYGQIWWNWAASSALFGFLVGLLGNRTRLAWGQFGKKGAINFNIAQVISHAAAWIVIAPVLDILIYSEPANKVFLQGAVAAAANIITTAIVGTLLCFAWAKLVPDKSSLKKED